MLFKQSKNAFVRTYGETGYITNQMTRWDRSYNETGADFLNTLSREVQDVESVVNNILVPMYDGVTADELREDYIAFLLDLEKNMFVWTGDTPEEVESKEIEFSYSLGNMKTQTDDYTQLTEYKVDTTTQDFNLQNIHYKPQIGNLQFELTSRCNERCIHCYIPNGKKDEGSDMPLEKVKSIIDEFAEMGGLHITLSGGEVFLHKDTIKIMQYCREKDMQISILSNLIALKDIHIPFIKAANVSIVQTSLYSVDPAIHDLITKVPGSCQKTKAAIEKLVAADIPVQISCPVMKANKSSYKEVMQYAKQFNIKSQTDYIMMAQADFDTQNLANRLSLDETEVVIRDIIEQDIDYRKMTKKLRPKSEAFKFDPEAYKASPLCGAGANMLCITESGDCYPCAGWQAYKCGNVNEKSLREIWEESDALEAVRKVTNASFPECLECEAANYCAMCLVRNYNESNGDMFKINRHFCDVAFLNKRLVEEYAAKGLFDIEESDN